MKAKTSINDNGKYPVLPYASNCEYVKWGVKKIWPRHEI